MKTKLITEVQTEPVSLADVKSHLRLDTGSDEDNLISGYISAARELGEDISGQAFASQTWEMYLDTFPDVDYIEWFFGPLNDLDSIKYKDCSGNELTMTENTDYLVDFKTFPGKIFLPHSKSWPTFVEYPYEAITIRGMCGYTGEEPYILPKRFKQSMLLHIGYMYKFRDTDIPKSHLDTIYEIYTGRKMQWL